MRLLPCSSLTFSLIALHVYRYVLMELVDTERDYVRDLSSVVDGYMANLQTMELPEDLVGKDKIIFANIAQILEFHKTYIISVVFYILLLCVFVFSCKNHILSRSLVLSAFPSFLIQLLGLSRAIHLFFPHYVQVQRLGGASSPALFLCAGDNSRNHRIFNICKHSWA